MIVSSHSIIIKCIGSNYHWGRSYPGMETTSNDGFPTIGAAYKVAQIVAECDGGGTRVVLHEIQLEQIEIEELQTEYAKMIAHCKAQGLPVPA